MKRLFLTALSVAFAFTLVFGLTACKNDDGNDNGGATEQTFTVTYDFDGALTRGGVTLTEKSETVKISEVASFTLPEAVKKGYTFIGWKSGDRDFGAANLSASVTLTPKFRVNSYIFAYDYGGILKRGETTLEDSSETVTYDNLEDFVLPTAEKRGYTFNGWNLGEVAFDKTALDAPAIVTLTPDFTVNTYTIIYDFDGELTRGGEKLTSNTETVTFDKLQAYKTPVAAKKGYTFYKWMNGGMEFDKSGVDKSATYVLTAKFTPNAYTLTYSYDGVLKRGGAELTVKQETVTADKLEAFVLPDAVKTGYTFNGWTVDGALFDKTALDESASLTLTPAFTANVYKVKYYYTENDAAEDINIVFEDTATFGAHYAVKGQQDLLEELVEKISDFGYDVIGWKVLGGDAFVSGDYAVDGDTKLVPVKSTETGNTFNLTVKVGTESRSTQIDYGSPFELPNLGDYGLSARKGYRYAWLAQNGSEIKSGVYNFKYSLVVTATEVKNKATVNFVVGPAGATVKVSTLTTVTAQLSTGDNIPEAVYTDNVIVNDGKIYVYKFAYWTSDGGAWSNAPEKAYGDNGEIVIETDGAEITLYAYFVLAQEAPNK